MNRQEKHTSRPQIEGAIAGEDDFFIPDLCNARSVLVLVIASELFALIVSVVSYPLPSFNWVSFALVSLLTQWVTLSSAAVICSMRPWLRKLLPSLVLFACLLIVMLNTAVFSILGEWVFSPEFSGFFPLQPLDHWPVLQNMLISVLISGMVFRYFLVQHQLRLKERSELTARLQSLQSRIRPHFLFNSMNIIASLIATDPDTAEMVVEDLSELFRASLKETANVVPLKTELDLCRKYCRIEQLRLGERLKVNWYDEAVDESVFEEAEIPMLLLQPLLENAIYHGIQPRATGGDINIYLSREKNSVVIRIVNPLPETSYYTSMEKQKKGNQIALDNIRHRLDAIYGDLASLRQSQENDEFVTVLSFPMHAPAYDKRNSNHL